MMRRYIPISDREHGVAYVIVLMISMLVTIIGIAALTATRIQLRAANLSADTEDTMLAARCAIEVAQYYTQMDSSWRTTRGAGVWASGLTLNGCTASVSVADAVDTDITNSPFDPITVSAVGVKGRVRQAMTVTLTPTITPLTCMTAAVCADDIINITNGRWTCSAPIATTSNFTAGGAAVIDSDVEAVGTITATGITGNKSAGATARTLPDPTSVFTYYVNRGTPISFSACGGKIENCLLSPSSNPWGTTNAEGIYVIDCGGKTFKIDNCRIVGTLVILNDKKDSVVDKEVNIEPAVAGYPALMSQSGMTMQYDSASLTESAVTGNLNPAGTPYKGVSNTTTTDTYPSTINGAVYVAGDLTLKNAKTMTGPLIVDGQITSNDDVTITWTAASATIAPAPGFTAPPVMKPLASSWKRVVN